MKKENNKNKKIFKKRHVTLIEMMIVMFLIALIISVIGYNYIGTLEEGKAFKTKIGMEKIEMILSLRLAEDPSLLEGIEQNWVGCIESSPLVKDSRALATDGWGEQYVVTRVNDKILVESKRYENHRANHRTAPRNHTN